MPRSKKLPKPKPPEPPRYRNVVGFVVRLHLCSRSYPPHFHGLILEQPSRDADAVTITGQAARSLFKLLAIPMRNTKGWLPLADDQIKKTLIERLPEFVYDVKDGAVRFRSEVEQR